MTLRHRGCLSEALYYATMILGMHSRTTLLQAAEPLSNRYLWDTRLDPIFAACSRCKHSWVPGRTPLELLFEKVSVTNPAGMQCSNCGFVLCRKCLSHKHVGVDLSIVSNSCPNCREPAMSAVVYPTGRLPMQLPRRQSPVKAVLVFREGPIPPDREYMEHLLDARSPDALDDGAELIGCPVPAGPAESKELVRSPILRPFLMRTDADLLLASFYQDLLPEALPRIEYVIAHFQSYCIPSTANTSSGPRGFLP